MEPTQFKTCRRMLDYNFIRRVSIKNDNPIYSTKSHNIIWQEEYNGVEGVHVNNIENIETCITKDNFYMKESNKGRPTTLCEFTNPS